MDRGHELSYIESNAPACDSFAFNYGVEKGPLMDYVLSQLNQIDTYAILLFYYRP
jgi:hypothetical protein